MKGYLSVLIIILNLFISNSSFATEKIALLDLNYVLKNSNAGKKILSELKIMDEKNRNKINQLEINLKKKQSEIKKLKNIISTEEYDKKVLNFNKDVEIFNKEKNKLIKSFENTKQKELNAFFKSLNAILSEYMEKEEISIILEKKDIIISKSENDISEKILSISNDKL